VRLLLAAGVDVSEYLDEFLRVSFCLALHEFSKHGTTFVGCLDERVPRLPRFVRRISLLQGNVLAVVCKHLVRVLDKLAQFRVMSVIAVRKFDILVEVLVRLRLLGEKPNDLTALSGKPPVRRTTRCLFYRLELLHHKITPPTAVIAVIASATACVTSAQFGPMGSVPRMCTI
jgi:hypothetical protein